MIDQTLGHYRIESKLGEGGMGVVWKARDLRLDRFVALKTLPAEKLADEDRRRRFVQEAKAASALNHPNIVHIYDIADSDTVPFIAMEYVPGRTLDELIGRKGLRLNETLKYAIQIADALARAHNAGIVHRDLKPSNIMADEHGLVKVLDFGLAKLTETASGEFAETETVRAPEGPITEEGHIVGTVAYMSPEQAEGKPVDVRSDIFSFGSLLYEMVTGRHAFHGDSKLSTLSAILKDEPKPVSSIMPDVPRDLEKVISRCLRKDPARRFQHMDDVKVALDELKEESDSGGLETGTCSTARPRRSLIWSAGSIAFLAAMTVGIWFVRSKSRTPQAPLVAVPLTSDVTFESYPTFSPDGNQVAYTGGFNENGIYVRIIGVTGPARRLTTQSGYYDSPAWSPDGRYIAFLRKAIGDTRARLVRIPLTGNPEQTLAEVLLPGTRFFGPRLAWFPDGRWLIVDDCREPKKACGLSALSVDTREKRRLTNPPPDAGEDDGPAISADGRWLAFSRGGEISQLYLLELSGDMQAKGEPQQITFENEAHDSPAWTADGREILFISGTWETSSLSRMAVSSGRPGRQQRVEFAGQFIGWPAISHQNQRFAYSRYHNTSWQIWRIEASAIKAQVMPAKLIWSTQSDEDPDYSPDGKRIAFKSSRSGRQEIWTCDSDGSNPIQLTSSVGSATWGPHWSADGRSILFTANVSGRAELFLINSQGGTPDRLIANTSAGSVSPASGRFSRDGKWIYFDSDRTGQSQIWKMPADRNRTGEKAVQLTRTGGHGGIESPNGKHVYYVGRTNSEPMMQAALEGPLMKVPVDGGEETQVLPSVLRTNFDVADEGIYFIPGPIQTRSSIHFLSFASGKSTRIADIGEPGFALSASPGPRGTSRSILYGQHEPFTANLMLVENFR